ncbi:hypothetical protein [Neptunomonas sp.]|uniref:hypothetical protein n=1 Tax=Neptunomonas sp. TaxID=1971898 RepID=UPI0025EEFCA9|nr:hypothetical protein [Neptunomonas sp.]
MAITATQRNDVISLLVGMFDAAPSAELMNGFVTSIEAGQSVASLANDLAATDEFASLYPTWLTNDEFATRFATNILDGNTDAATLTAGIDFVKASLNGGASRGETANTVVTALMAVDVADPTWGSAAQGLLNKVDVATYFATTKLNAESDFASLQAVVANVNADTTSVSNQKVLIDAGLDSTAQNLTTGQDMLTGSAGNDAFTAWIFNNSNSAQSGDVINGGAGTDTLMAEIGNSQAQAISLKTESVEVAHFRAQAEATDSADNDIQDGGTDGQDGQVQIDAQDMNGTKQYWSTDSRANLVIEDVREDSHTTTLGFRNADAGDVNYEVYYDTDHITAPDGTTAGSQLFLELLDLESMADDGTPLSNNPYNGFKFTIDGVEHTVAGAAPVTTTYVALLADLNAALDLAGLTSISASLGETFSKFNSDDGLKYEGTQIVLTNTGSEELGAVGWTTPTGDLPADTNIHTAILDAPPSTTNQLTQVDVILDNVGRGSKAGDFIAGNISQGTVSGSQGIQQFNIDVDRNSWVDQVRSTNNTLEEVFVENIGSNGTVRIDVLNDVRVFDASSMSNDVTLTADLNESVIAKYLDLTDTASNPDADDVNFNYTMGSANDKLTLTVEESAVGHEDFILNVTGGAGNDNLTVSVVEGGVLAPTADDWYANQTQGVNVNELNIVSGAGNDYVNVMGGGDYIIEAGTGDDTVFVDQTAAKAVWALGAQAGEAVGYTGANAFDVLSDAALASTNVLFKTKLTVSFNGFETTVDVTAGTNYQASQLTINNAIKQAIDSDRVLSDLLSYKDGPGNVLFIESKVDDIAAETLEPIITVVGTGTAAGGTYQAADIAALTATEKTALITGTGSQSDIADAALAVLMNTAITNHNVHTSAAEVEVTGIVGAVSIFDNDSTIHGDAGDNLIALASDATSNNTIVFDTTWTKTSIIGFDDDTAGEEDILDFTAYLTNKLSLSGSSVSEARIATTLNADATTEVNSVTVSTDATFTTTDTFAGLTEAKLLASLNNVATTYASLDDTDLNAQTNAGGITSLVGATGEAVVMIHNNLNVGEYKVFQLTWDHNATTNTNADYTAANLLGVVDFGTDATAPAASEIAALALLNLA